MRSQTPTIKKNIFNVAKSRISAGFRGSTVIIPHVCNNIGLFGAGFAAAIRQEFPVVASNFEMLGKKSKLGYVQYIETLKDQSYGHKLIFANMIAQNKTISPSNTRPLNYEALVKCMINVREYIGSLSLDHVEIHCPKFGSGLAGGNWLLINDLISDIWHHQKTYIYTK